MGVETICSTRVLMSCMTAKMPLNSWHAGSFGIHLVKDRVCMSNEIAKKQAVVGNFDKRNERKDG